MPLMAGFDISRNRPLFPLTLLYTSAVTSDRGKPIFINMRAKFLVLSCLLAVSAFAADVTGKWTADVPGRQGATQTVTMNLKSDGAALTGTFQGARGGPVDISDGKVDGDKVSFTVTREFQGNSIKMLYEGTASGGEIKFKSHPEQAPDRVAEFTAKKQ
jgi:hypothetical protein